jgi:hypothetical protein
MQNAVDTTLVTDVARDVLSEVAPQEVPILAAASKAYFDDPAAALRQWQTRDDVLGFGLDSLTVLVTPAVLHIVSEVFESLLRVATKAVEEGLSKEIPQVIRAMFRRFHSADPDTPSVLTRQQIGLIHANVLQAAKKLRLPDVKAQSLADAIAAQLVLARE